MRLLVSACLLGCACRYDGKSKENGRVMALLRRHEVLPVCPEVMGGLGIPRPKSERCGERMVTQGGQDVTDAYEKGAGEALRLARLFGCEAAILKEKSPACGCGCIYDGTFSGRLIAGNGVLTALLLSNGLPVYGESKAGVFLTDVPDGIKE